MLVPRSMFHLHEVGDPDSTHYALGGVRFVRTADGKPRAVATDGRRMMVAEWDEDPPDEYPTMAGCDPSPNGKTLSVTIPREVCRKAVKLAEAAKKSPKPILARNVALDEHTFKMDAPDEDQNIPLGATDLADTEVITARTSPGRFRQHGPLQGGRRTDEQRGRVVEHREPFLPFWHGPNGEEIKIQLCLVDCGYLPHTIDEAIAQDGRTRVVIPSRGVPISAASKTMGEWKYDPGDRRGLNWGYFWRKGRRFRILEYDANAWKTFHLARLSSVPGEPGSLSLFGRDPEQHQLYADHLAAEIPKEVECQGRRVR